MCVSSVGVGCEEDVSLVMVSDVILLIVHWVCAVEKGQR